MTFTRQDIEQIQSKGITVERVEQQIERFRTGFPYASLERPAIPGDGVVCLGKEEQQKAADDFRRLSAQKKILRFVPASGAATRMFKVLFAAREELEKNPEADLPPDAEFFFTRIRDFAFHKTLSEFTKTYGKSPQQMTSGRGRLELLNLLLEEEGLGYAGKPKGQILFHDYPEGPRTAFEEHLVESAGYAVNSDRSVVNHFTVSPQHLDGFKRILVERQSILERRFDVRYHTSFSEQKPSTDTIAVDPHNHPFRLDDGTLLFRPGGHGALIENLNDLDADLIFIKNIDNVAPDHLRGETLIWKQVLGGVLLYHLEKIFRFQKMLDQDTISAGDIQEMTDYGRNTLNLDIPPDAGAGVLKELFFRPVRVCGMVRNEGEPGGGPFWVKGADGRISLQIVETAQINPDDQGQQKILKASTHFNPVDLVCSVRDFRGKKYNLLESVDPETGFISEKSFNGRDLKALELPGLWNGAMARWITLFVEVPAATFTPVKTVVDLLRKEHQPAGR